MAKTYRKLWPKLVSWDNLLAAYHACRRRKRCKPEVLQFDFDWEGNLLQLQRELMAGTYTPGDYHHFFVYEPKRRKISAAPFRDRVVHHALVRVLEPLYEHRFIHDSYACRKKKGTHRALDRAQQYLRRYGYYLKTDIVKFFPNVDHAVLFELLARKIHDRDVLELIRTIIASGEGVLTEEASRFVFPGDDLFALLRPTGLPIGNLTSQFFANVLLDPLDHFIKEKLRVPGYVRYADDLVLLADDKQVLWEVCGRLQDELAALRLRLHPEKTQVRPAQAGLKFLGFKLWPHTRRIQQDSLRRFNRRLRRQKQLFAAGAIAPSDIKRSLDAWTAHVAAANATGIRRVLWRRLRFCRTRR